MCDKNCISFNVFFFFPFLQGMHNMTGSMNNMTHGMHNMSNGMHNSSHGMNNMSCGHGMDHGMGHNCPNNHMNHGSGHGSHSTGHRVYVFSSFFVGDLNVVKKFCFKCFFNWSYGIKIVMGCSHSLKHIVGI